MQPRGRFAVCVHVHVYGEAATRFESVCMRPYVSGWGPGRMTLISMIKDVEETTDTNRDRGSGGEEEGLEDYLLPLYTCILTTQYPYK